MTGRTATRLLGAIVAPALLLTACGGGSTDNASTNTGSSSDTASTDQATGDPVTIGVVTGISGPLASYGAEYLAGLDAGLDYATKGTDAAGGHKITLEKVDAAGDPEKAISAATDLVGRGVKIIVGTASSGVALQMAPFAEENDILYISGPAAADAITGINANTFRSGRQTYQDVATAASLLDNANGNVLVYVQDGAFGEGNVTAVKTVLGGKGATVDSLLAPASANDFTPYAQQIKDKSADLLFVAWAGDTTSAMWQSLQQQGVFDATTVVTGLGDKASWSSYGNSPAGIKFLAHYFPDAADNPVNQAMVKAVPEADLFTPDGFVAAQMIVRALTEGDPTDTASMIKALEGWTFDAPKGEQTVRASDHAMLQPMFTASLTGPADSRAAKLLDTLDAKSVAPPEASK